MQLARSCRHSRTALVPASSLFFAIHLCALGISGAHGSRGKAGLEIGARANCAARKSCAEKHEIAEIRTLFLVEEPTIIRSNYTHVLPLHFFHPPVLPFLPL